MKKPSDAEARIPGTLPSADERRRVQAASWIGMAVFGLGAVVLIGWFLNNAFLTRLLPGLVPTKATTAAAFMLLGAGLGLRSHKGWAGRALAWAAAGIVAALAAATLAEYAGGWEFWVDELIIRDPQTPQELHSGRMAFATATGLLLASCAMAAIELATWRPRFAALGHALSAGVVAIGALGLIGYAVDVAFLYTWYAAGAMSLATAGGFALLGVGLLAKGNAVVRRPTPDDERITRAAALALIVAAGATGIAGIAALESQVQRGALGEVRRLLTTQVGELATNLELRQTRAEIVTTRPNMLRYLRILADEPPRRGEARDVVQGVLESFLQHDFSQLAVLGPTGEEIARAGPALPVATLEIPIGDGATRLVWRGGAFLHHELALSDSRGALGVLLAEQRLPRVTQLVQANHTGFSSGEFLLCRPVGLRFQCLPSRLSAGAVVVPPAPDGSRRLAERALAEGTGVAGAIDYRGHRVIGAYEHLPSLGLVAVLKVDVDEIYAPIRRQVGLALVLVGGVIVGGIGLVRIRVRPLATDLETRVRQRTADLLQTTQLLEREVAERTRAEHALRESEERYRLVIEHIHDAVFLLDLESRFIYGNPRVAELTGYRVEELVGKPAATLLTPAGREASAARRDTLRARPDTPFSYETEIVRKDGTRVWVEVDTTSVVRDGEILARLGVARDITHRKEAEAALQANTAALAKAAERLGVLHEIDRAIIAIDDPKAIADAALRRLAPLLGDARATVALFDYAAGEGEWLAAATSGRGFVAAGRRFPLELVGDLEPLRRGELQVTDTSQLAASEYAEALLAEGIPRLLRIPLLAGGELIGALSFGATDRAAFTVDELQIAKEVADQIAIALTQARLRAELLEHQRQTEASEARFRALVDGSIQGIYLADLDYRIRYANAAAARMYGYDGPDALIGRRTLDLYQPEEHGRLDMYARARARGDPAPTRYEAQGRRQDGTPVWLEVLVSMVVQDGESLYQTTLIDITERKQAEAEKAQVEAQLQQAQKLESIGQLAGGVAHDLNNLLSVVIGRGQLLLEQQPPEAPARRGLQMIVSSAERGAGVVKQLLTFSRRQPVDLRILDLNRVVADIMPMLRRFIGEQVELVVRAAEPLGRVRADKSQLDQIIMNLVINARDAMPEGGQITIETAPVQIGEDYARQHVGTAPGPHVMLAVTDTGIGMDAATQARIFEPFFTTKEPGKGTGLGLATVYGIVKQSGGSIWVYSELGEGTSFKIYLPRVERPAEVEVAPAPPGQGTETVLVAEDEAEVRELVREVLQTYGYTVLEAARPADALLIAERHTGPIHLLVTDVIMPQMSGRQLAEQLAPLRPEMRVLYMSGYPGEAIVQHGRLEPGTEYLPKPFTPAALAAKVRAVLDVTD